MNFEWLGKSKEIQRKGQSLEGPTPPRLPCRAGSVLGWDPALKAERGRVFHRR